MYKKDLRITFMGTPDFAVGSLKVLLEENYNVVAVVTMPDKAVGRHASVLQASAVKQYAVAHQIPVLQPERLKDTQFLDELRAFHADLQVVVAFRMLPEIVWSMPRFGTFNVHAALLPQYRGAAPINWAIIHGEKQTGVTTFFLDKDIDTGRIIRQKTFDIPFDANAEYVHDGLMTLGATLCRETIDLILANDGNIDTIAQDDIAVPEEKLHAAPKIFKETCEINWHQSAVNIHNFVRGLSPYPGAWAALADENGKVVKIFATKPTDKACEATAGSIRESDGKLYVATADCWLEILSLQLAGKKRMEAHDFLNGSHLDGHCFSSSENLFT